MVNVKDVKTYILHCKTLDDRRLHMQNAINHFGLDVSWILDHDAVDLNESVKREYYSYNLQEASERTSKIWSSGHDSRFLTDKEISLAIKHTIAMRCASESSSNISLILEDDCLFIDNFDNLFTDYLAKTPKDWDVIHVGNGYGMKPENYYESKEIAYRMKHPASRCAEAILVKKDTAIKISKTMKPFYLAADWELGYQYWLHDLNVYWWEPSLITQGSHSGAFKSSLR